MKPAIRVRRVYEDPERADGARVLVDRLWPRGLRKDAAVLDDWLRDVAPSDELRRWYGHDPAKFDEFRRRYMAELTGPGAQQELGKLRALAAKGPLTLLTATKDSEHSQSAVLADLLKAAAEPEAEQALEGGDAACWAHLVCPECGAVVSEGHQAGCPAQAASG
jgi:uncharacterized protein YeaO (DUF488 family)